MSKRDFLFEIGTEELPPKALKRLSDSLRDGVTRALDTHDLAYVRLQAFATPRRLALLIQGLDERQPDRSIERRGPPVKIAFDADGNPTRAAEKFVASCGVPVDELSTVATDKGEYLFYRGVAPGQATAELLPEILATALAELPIPRPMRWGSRDDEFVRPVHWVVMLWGDQALDASLLGVAAGRKTRGHRFHTPEQIELTVPSDYAAVLEKRGRVVADFAARRAIIAGQIEAVASRHDGKAIVDDALLDEVTALVEWPVAIAGHFDERFLALPREVLISTLQEHQRYFPLADAQGALKPLFITVSNIDSRNPAAVSSGNERVVRPRLTDAEFFFTQDRKRSLQSRVADLGDVVFQKQLGSLHDKAQRVEALAAEVAAQIGANDAHAVRAAQLGKCDLLTDMVGEFPDLQGTMGRYYALHDGLPADIAAALEEQYLPRFAGDALPQTPTGQALAIADKTDTLTGIFAIGKKPSGTRDPFGLRRAALGVLRIIIERELDVDLRALIAGAADRIMPFVANAKKPAYPDAAALGDDVYSYLTERLRGYFLDAPEQGISSDMFNAVLATGPTRPLDFAARLAAVREFMQLEASASLSAANKRIANILKSADGAIAGNVDAGLVCAAQETALLEQVEAVTTEVMPLLDAREYGAALRCMARLREPVDAFFDGVMVMDDDLAVRANRLALLSRLRELFLHVADFSRLQ